MGEKYLKPEKPRVKWIEKLNSDHPLDIEHKDRKFYKKCVFNELMINIGDYVLIRYSDVTDSDSTNGCDVAKILNLYKLTEKSKKEPHRAIVQWYSRPDWIPGKHLENCKSSIDFSCEVIEDHRSYDSDISLETILRKCYVILGDASDCPTDLIKEANISSNCAIYVCRFQYTKANQYYKLKPLNYDTKKDDKLGSITSDFQKKINLKDTPLNKNTNSADRSKKVTPIKIIGGQKVIRVSERKVMTNDEICNMLMSSSKENNMGYSNYKVENCSARRNLNLSMDIEDEGNKDEREIINLTKTKKDLNLNEDKYNTSIRRSPVHLVSFEIGTTNNSEKNIHSTKKRISDMDPINSTNSICSTPTKRTKSKNETPHRKRSILKSDSRKYEGNKATTLTPSQKLKMIRSGELTPSITERQLNNINSYHKSDLQLARESLHVSVVPKSLPCRETEFKNIYTFLESKIQDQCGGCMYVSGVPGTGKTATVTGVINSLQTQVVEGQLLDFKYVEINGMRLTEPRQAYVQIYKQLTGKTLSWEHAQSLLEKQFRTPNPRRTTIVLLADELDILCNRRQDVVYNLLDWSSVSAARLILVTIANTMDLPERVLRGKVTSRLGLTRLTFQPYSHKQLQEIVTTRLGGSSDAFKSDAVQLVARKVAAVSGDARRALDICRRATEIADSTINENGSSGEVTVNMLHVQQALNEMIASAKVKIIKNCSQLEKIFLQALVAEISRTGVEETSLMGIYTQMESITAFLGIAMPATGRIFGICSKLGSQHLIITEHSRNDIFQKVLLNVSMDDIHYALQVCNF